MKHLSLILLLTAHWLVSAEDIKPFKAVYEVSRDGKVTGLQTTELSQSDNGLWQLTDVMEGTRGMASVLGFERREQSTFSWHNQQLTVLEHQMEQKAAFSKRRYRFSWDANSQQYTGQHKGDAFTVRAEKPGVVSAHMLPLAIGLAACQQLNHKSVMLLKSKKIRDYQFNINLNSQPMTAQRVFATGSKRSSESTLDPDRLCLPAGQTHREEDQPVITSRLVSFTWL